MELPRYTVEFLVSHDDFLPECFCLWVTHHQGVEAYLSFNPQLIFYSSGFICHANLSLGIFFHKILRTHHSQIQCKCPSTTLMWMHNAHHNKPKVSRYGTSTMGLAPEHTCGTYGWSSPYMKVASQQPLLLKIFGGSPSHPWRCTTSNIAAIHVVDNP